MTDRAIVLLRAQTWERVKGELNGILETFDSKGRASSEAAYQQLGAEIEAFIEKVDNEGWIYCD